MFPTRVFTYQYQTEVGHSPQMTLDIDVPAKKAATAEVRQVP